MSNYTKATNFTAKDGLPTGNSGKIVKGAEIDTELTAVASAISSKADLNSPALTGTPTAPTATAATNTTQLATTAFTQAALSALIPTGIITLWSGSVATIPSGWALCNGSSGTPDLRNRFVVGAGSTYSVDATGGSATSTLTSNELPAHTHVITTTGTATSENAHSHTFSGTTSGQSQSHTHTATVSDPGHTHASPKNAAPNGGGAGICMAGAASGNSPGYDTLSAFTGISVTNGNASEDHTHTYSGTTSTTAAHTHTLSLTSTAASTGSGASFTNLPPYYALAYIMKL
jgi:microcystin-dependent protein